MAQKKTFKKPNEFFVAVLLFLFGISLIFALFSFAQAAGFLPTPEPQTNIGKGFQEYPIDSSHILGASAKALFFDISGLDFSTIFSRLREMAVL